MTISRGAVCHVESTGRPAVGDLVLEARHCPGHSSGSVVFFHPESRLVISGDVLFQGSVGRTDLPRGDERRTNPFVGEGATGRP